MQGHLAGWASASAAALAFAGIPAGLPAARGQGSSTYEGRYTNAFAVGRLADGRPVAVMAGKHERFPYDDPGSDYDQVAVAGGGADPIVLTGRPHLAGLVLNVAPTEVRMNYSGSGLVFQLRMAAVQHPPRFEGDPGQLGDFFLGQGAPSGQSPGFVYTPYELRSLVSGAVGTRGRLNAAASLHGQAEEGRIDGPTDRRFRSAYDYLAGPSLAGDPFTYVAFDAHALHTGTDGALDSYFRSTASDRFTMEAGKIVDDNVHAAPEPFDNTHPLPAGAENLGQWSADLGPGILYRKLVGLRDRSGRRLLALSETIKEDTGAVPDTTAPVMSAARARPARFCVRRSRRCRRPGVRLVVWISEDALVTVSAGPRASVRRSDAKAGAVALPYPGRGLAPGRHTLLVRATDELGNSSRKRLRVTVRR